MYICTLCVHAGAASLADGAQWRCRWEDRGVGHECALETVSDTLIVLMDHISY